MAPPNLLFIPTVATEHATAAFNEVTRGFDENLGLIDRYDESAIVGGQFLYMPRLGRLSTGFVRPDALGTITAALTPATSTYNDVVGPVILRTLNFRQYSTESQMAYKMTSAKFSAEIGRQIGKEAILEQLLIMYQVGIACLYSVGTSHRYSIAATMSASIIQAGKALLGDNGRLIDVGFMHSASQNRLAQSVLNPASPGIVAIFGETFHGGVDAVSRCQNVDWITDDRVPDSAPNYRSLAFVSRNNSNSGVAPYFMSVQRPLEITSQHYTGSQSVYFDQQPQFAAAYGMYGKHFNTALPNPSTANITNAGNWTDAYDGVVASGHKTVQGILIETQD